MTLRLIKSKLIHLNEKGDLVIPRNLFQEMRTDDFLVLYVRSRRELVVLDKYKEIDKKDDDCRILDVMLYLEDKMMSLIIEMMSNISKEERVYNLWTSGICNVKKEDGKSATILGDYEGCVWQGFMRVSKGMTIEELENKIMEINVSEGKKVVRGVKITEVS